MTRCCSSSCHPVIGMLIFCISLTLCAPLALFGAIPPLGRSRSIVRPTRHRLSDRGENCPLGRCCDGATLLQYTQKILNGDAPRASGSGRRPRENHTRSAEALRRGGAMILLDRSLRLL